MKTFMMTTMMTTTIFRFLYGLRAHAVLYHCVVNSCNDMRGRLEILVVLSAGTCATTCIPSH